MAPAAPPPIKPWLRPCFCIYFLDVTYYYINQIIYIFRGVARNLVGGTLDKISYMNSFQVLYYNGVAKISLRGRDIQQKYTHQRLLKNFEKFAQKFKKFSKIFQK